MREKTLPVKLEVLRELGTTHGSATVARKLNISPQRWHNYKIGKNDIPESIVLSMCQTFGLRYVDVVRFL